MIIPLYRCSVQPPLEVSVEYYNRKNFLLQFPLLASGVAFVIFKVNRLVITVDTMD